ncbi:MAG TPA: hypothetical protein VG756_01160 [Pseudonocardiaceae bacterium]|nr:hypothetical protein [Pseudonocardiaceae bacterium]
MTILAVLAVLAAGSIAVVYWVSHLPKHLTPECLVSPPGGSTGSSASSNFTLDPEQMDYAATIAAVGEGLGMPDHAVTVALATALQESGLHNLTAGDRDSAGLFQQRPSEGWGTYAQVTDPVYASTAFYQKLDKLSDWQTMSVTEAAQEVQHSAAPDAYATWEPEARAMAGALTGETQGSLTCQDLTIGPPSEDIGTVARNEWGTATLSGSHSAARAWAIGTWLVSHSQKLGVDSVTVGGRTWTAASGSWSAGNGAATGEQTVSLHQVTAPPPSS